MTQSETLDLIQNIMCQLGVKTSITPSQETAETPNLFYARNAIEYGISSFLTVNLVDLKTFFGIAQDGRIFTACNSMNDSPIHKDNEIFSNFSDQLLFVNTNEDENLSNGEKFWTYIINDDDSKDIFMLTTPEEFLEYYETLAVKHGLRPRIIFKFKDCFGQEETVGVRYSIYPNDSLACLLDCPQGKHDLFFKEHFAVATVNLDIESTKDFKKQFIDENDLYGIGRYLTDNGIAKSTGIAVLSGLSIYPKYEFNLSEEDLRDIQKLLDQKHKEEK